MLKNLYIIVLFMAASVQSLGQSLTTGAIASSSLCGCSNVSVPYSGSGTFNAGNVFTAELSDASGSFATPVNIGTLSGTASSGNVSATIPCNTTAGTSYRIRVVSSNVAYVGTDNGSNLTINPAFTPTISLTTPTTTICTGTSVTVTANLGGQGTSPTFNWKKNGIIIPGVVFGSYTDAALANGDVITCDLTSSNACALNPVTSNALTFTVNPIVTPSVTIAANPAANVCPGTNITFTAMPTNGGATPSYQWKVNGVNKGTNSATFSSGTLVAGDIVSVVLTTNAPCPTVNTATASFNANVDTPPAITVQPADATTCIGSNATFNVTATGAGLTYQWQHNTGVGGFVNITNNATYSGTATATLTVNNVNTSLHNYQYRCIVSGNCPSPVTSANRVLTVKSYPIINVQPTPTRLACAGTPTFMYCEGLGSDIVYQWQVNTGSGFTNVTNTSPYSGATTSTLIINPTAAQNNNRYRCIVTGFCGTPLTSDSCILTVTSLAAITTQPTTQNACPGADVQFSVVGTGTNITYSWETDMGTGWQPIAGNVGPYVGFNQPTLNVYGVNALMFGYKYRCKVSNSCNTVTSNAVTLNVYPYPTATISSVSDTSCAGALNFTLTTQYAGTPPTAYAWKKNGTTVATTAAYNATGLVTGDVIICDVTSAYICPAKPIATSNSKTITDIPYSTTSVTITSPLGPNGCVGSPVTFTANPINGGKNPVYKWKKNATTISGATNVTYTDGGLITGDVIICEMTSSLRCPSPAVAVSSAYNITIYPVELSTVTVSASPDSIGCTGAAMTFNSHFTKGGATPKYQWQLNGIDIPGAINASYSSSTLNNIDAITLKFASSQYCVAPIVSAPVTVHLTPTVTPAVQISAATQDNKVIFTADIQNGGNNPILQWRVNGKDVSGANMLTYTAIGLNSNDKVSLFMVSDLECVTSQSTLSNSITVIEVTGVEDVNNDLSEVSVFPNPNNGTFTVRGKLANNMSNENVGIEVLNAIGQVVYKDAAKAEGRELNINVNTKGSLAAGMYTLRLSLDGQVQSLRFMIKN